MWLSRVCICGLIGLAVGCTSPKSDVNSGVRIRISYFPETNNPVGQWNFDTSLILSHLYQRVEKVDKGSLELLPMIGTRQAVMIDSLISVTFEIRDSIYWDKRFRITPDDVELSLKVYNLPGIDNRRKRLQLSHIIGFEKVTNKPNQFILKVVGNWEDVSNKLATFPVLPSYIFDPQGLLEAFALSDIIDEYKSLESHPDVVAYKRYFESQEFGRKLSEISGPYQITNWNQGQSVTLEKNEAWWGEGHYDTDDHLKNYPNTISFQYIPDATVALLALKNDAIDVLSRIAPAEFKQMQTDEDLTDRFHLLTPTTYAFVYLAINSRKSHLNKTIRRALASLIPYDELVEIAALSFAQRTIGPINPIDTLLYNDEEELTTYDPDLAEKLLTAEGCTFQDGEWKDPTGEVISFDLIYRAGQPIYESIALIMKDRMQDFGIQLNIEAVESSLQMSRMKSHDFDLSIRSFRGGPFAHNFSPLFSREAANVGGLNFSGFGSQESDDVINSINNASKKGEKIIALKRLQALLHQEKTMLFLFFEKDRIAVSKRFSNVHGYSVSPGYEVSQFQLTNLN